MADRPHTFRESGARRIVDAVRRVEGLPAPGIASPPSVGAPREAFGCRAVQVTTVPGAALGQYGGKLLNADFGGSYLTINFYNLSEVSGGPTLLKANDVVTIQRVDTDALSSILTTLSGGAVTVTVGNNWMVVGDGDGGLRIDQDDGGGDICLGTTRMDVAAGTGVTVAVSQVGPAADKRAKLTISAAGGGGGGGSTIRTWEHITPRFLTTGESIVVDSSQDWRGKTITVHWSVSYNGGDGTGAPGDPIYASPENFYYGGGSALYDDRGAYGGSPPGSTSHQAFRSKNGRADTDAIITAPPTAFENVYTDSSSALFVDTTGNLRWRRVAAGGGEPHNNVTIIHWAGG